MLARRLLDFPGLGWTNPRAEIERMKRRVDALSELVLGGTPSRVSASPGVFPNINLTEDPGHYYVRAELAGLKASDLDLQVSGRNLSIAGERKISREGENVRYHRREREVGEFSRVVSLPGEIDGSRAAAKMVDGILTVTIPKAVAARPRRITVK